mmetsp:Transcript_20286/g.51931  ORF Transcript_20286/g.51931 Transcript_20286/m.51931 type:complete len:85 (-) Transcript_20286:112-366(-)|eukprot:jgi/Tetstr1/466705/TSEL_011178.t1
MAGPKADSKGKAEKAAEANAAVEAEEKQAELTLEEDDLFEEFEHEAVEDVEGEGPTSLWAPEWEDEELGDQFTARLKAELSAKR